MPKIMTNDAKKIAHKLRRGRPQQHGHQQFDVAFSDGKRHELVRISYNGQMICQYGLQRASTEKDHSYVAEQLFLTRTQAYDLARCPLSIDDYIAILVEKGEIDQPEPPAENPGSFKG